MSSVPLAPVTTFTITYTEEQHEIGLEETLIVSPLAFMRAETKFKKSFAQIFNEVKMGEIAWLAHAQIRIIRPGNSQPDFEKWLGKVQHIEIDFAKGDDKDDAENPT